MKLTLTQPCSWTLLLLLLSNLLLWEDVALVPLCEEANGQCQLSLGYFFDQARELSENINVLSSETFKEFDQDFGIGQQVIFKFPMDCHISSVSIPSNATQAHEMQPTDLLNVTMHMVAAWEVPVKRAVDEMADVEAMPGFSAIITKLRALHDKITKLMQYLQDVKTLLSQVHLEAEQNENYLAWSGLPYLEMDNKRSRLFVYHTLLRCLNSDAEKIATFVKTLRCQMVPSKC
ncbi:prolactin-5A1-like [Nannospalax galili]|uniref:prolactin-5A1-like n=1 Tax=Nannospalax galili TaxID=1026970 RepID=UPI00111C7B16|nr:prolactin-5A1-like [Nannospalax galili]